FVHYSNEYYGQLEINDHQMCVTTNKAIKCKRHKEKDFREIMPINGDNYNLITMGANHICSLESVLKKVKCWGDNKYGQLGTGPLVFSYSEFPVEVVNSQTELSDMSAGYNHTCYSDDSNKAYCWGDNSFGQLGITGNKFGTVLVPNITQGRILSVASKGNYSCVIDLDDKVMCWGEMYYNGIKKIFSPPISIPGVSPQVYSLVLGLEESCVHDEDDFYCWGKNIKGVEKRSIGKIHGKIQIGDGFACISKSLGVDEVACWGKNDKGQLGVEMSIKESLVPIAPLPWTPPLRLFMPIATPTPTPIWTPILPIRWPI
ncbi:MAG: hypothetical protein HQK51_16480, partial [Oligoflexia bacterium]|nr:hypothetical protein [Oligoflexia bacterium]